MRLAERVLRVEGRAVLGRRAPQLAKPALVKRGESLDPAKAYGSPHVLGVHGEAEVPTTHGEHPPLVLDFAR